MFAVDMTVQFACYKRKAKWSHLFNATSISYHADMTFSYTPVSDPEGYYKNFKHLNGCVSFSLVQWQTQSRFSPGTLEMRYKHK